MWHGFSGAYSFFGILFHQTSDQVLQVIRPPIPNIAWEWVFANCHFGENFWVIFAAEWRLTTEHDEEDNSNTPQVTLLIVASLEDLRRYVISCPIHLMHALLWVEQMSGAKVYNFDGALLLGIYQYVFRFEVPVGDVLLVTVADCRQNLLGDDCSFQLCKSWAFLYLLEEFSAITQFLH